MKKSIIAAALVSGAVAAGAAFLLLRTDGPAPQAMAQSGGPAPASRLVDLRIPARLSAAAEAGEAAYNQFCASCHGANAAGQADTAPPLVHVIYEPSHHGDLSFVRAVKQGVRAHHWQFGDMPPVVPAPSEDEIALIIAYIRELQRANGIN